MPTIVIIGAGPNLGDAIARRFAQEGFSVGLISRGAERLSQQTGLLTAAGITCDFAAADVREPEKLQEAIRSLGSRLGPVDVLEYSPLPAREFMKPILETSVDDVRGPLEFSVLGAVAAATAVAAGMIDRGSGTILYTTGGAAVKPYPARAGVGISFAGEVAYARMLHEELSPHGVHVAHTAIAGRIAPGAAHEPTDIAELLWQHHTQPGEFQTLVGFDG